MGKPNNRSVSALDCDHVFIKDKQYWIALIPAVFITDMILVYILNAAIGFNLPLNISHIGGVFLTLIFIIWFFRKAKLNKENKIITDLEV